MDILVSEEAGVRTLHFGSSWVQGAMRIARPWNLELAYTREMMACLLFRGFSNWPRKVLIIGLGAGSLTKYLHRNCPDAQMTVVEIDPSVHVAAQMHFKFPDESRHLSVVYEDGADFVARCKQQFDLILVDGFDENARVGRLNSLEFYLNAKTCLKQDGLLVCNMLSKRKDYLTSLKRLGESFDGEMIAFDSQDPGNVIAFAGHQPVFEGSLKDYKSAAFELKEKTGLNLLPALTRWGLHTEHQIGIDD